MNGFINVLKAPGITSSTVVSLMRNILHMKKVGHAGTLDPSACGVLPIMIGKATKLFDYLDDEGKEYISEFVFGVDTDTLDMQGKILNKNNTEVTSHKIKNILNDFVGEIHQFPPKVSAISINGQKAYSLQRQGVDFDVPERKVYIKSIELIRQTGENRFLFKITCSRGTYIRSLCRDIAHKIDTYGYINYLNRTKSGYFTIDNAYTVEELRKIDINKALISIDEPISHLKRVDIDSIYMKQLLNGVGVKAHCTQSGISKVYCDNIFIGLGKQIKKDNEYLIKITKRLVDEEDT